MSDTPQPPFQPPADSGRAGFPSRRNRRGGAGEWPVAPAPNRGMSTPGHRGGQPLNPGQGMSGMPGAAAQPGQPRPAGRPGMPGSVPPGGMPGMPGMTPIPGQPQPGMPGMLGMPGAGMARQPHPAPPGMPGQGGAPAMPRRNPTPGTPTSPAFSSGSASQSGMPLMNPRPSAAPNQPGVAANPEAFQATPSVARMTSRSRRQAGNISAAGQGASPESPAAPAPAVPAGRAARPRPKPAPSRAANRAPGVSNPTQNPVPLTSSEPDELTAFSVEAVPDSLNQGAPVPGQAPAQTPNQIQPEPGEAMELTAPDAVDDAPDLGAGDLTDSAEVEPSAAPGAPGAKPPAETADSTAPVRDQSKPPAEPKAPKPPPNTLKSNLIGIFSGLFITPVAMSFMICGCKTMMDAAHAGGIPAVILGLFEILAATSLFALTGVVTGYFSSLSWAVSALWPVLLTVLAGPIRSLVASHNDTLTGVSDRSLWWDFLGGVSTLTASGLFPTMAIVMVGASLASQVAYLSGREMTRKEHQVMETVDKQPGEPVVPRSRHRDHFLSIVIALVCNTGGMLSLIPLHDRLAVITGATGHITEFPPVAQYGLPILGILLLFIEVYAGSRSAAGLFVAGFVCGVIPGVVLTFGEVSTSGWTEHMVQFFSERLTASMHVSGGPLTAFGFVLIACGLTLYWCRQSGKRDQLEELASTGVI
ncbi:adhesin [Mobiluncus mulieris]|uniref:adhesin n=1 Tax=Mobiluncus mulieris TaxID=2052 RepID=UPI00147041B1|nr:adhesin [Mobiluncus mulieris]